MAAVPVTINGVICDLYGRTITGPVKIVGEMVRSDVGVGGGPIVPPDEKPPLPPLGIWPGPGDPDFPGGGKPPVDLPPPSVWPPGPGIDWPEHPIVLPPVDEKPPLQPGDIITWTPVWTPNKGWFVVGVPNVPHPAPSKK